MLFVVGDCYVTLYERPDGKSLGAGLVEFRDLSKAQEAVDKMNRYEVSGRKIIVREVRIFKWGLRLNLNTGCLLVHPMLDRHHHNKRLLSKPITDIQCCQQVEPRNCIIVCCMDQG